MFLERSTPSSSQYVQPYFQLYCFILAADALAGRSNIPTRSFPSTTLAPSTVYIEIPVDAIFLIAFKTGGRTSMGDFAGLNQTPASIR